jgi:hypothetical protein
MRTHKIVKKLRIFRWFFTVFLVLLSATWIDYIVHGQLYSYGLVFSFDWAVHYWLALSVLFVTIGLQTSASYWVSRRETARHKATSILLGLTVIWVYIGGYLDLLHWLVFYRSLPPADLEWWWSPFHWVLGLDWRTGDQLVYSAAMTIILAALWVGWLIYIRRK